MAKFVCVRVVQGWGIDLNLYQFDFRQTWAAFFLNPDKTVYGRYGTESTFKNSGTTNTLEGFKKAVKAALDLHAGYPANKAELDAKTGPAAPWKTPETIPFLQGKPPSKAPYSGKGTACIHCHAAWGGVVKSLEQAKQPVPLKLQAPWPMPDVVGLDLDPKEKATVTGVDAGSAAEKAGFKAGDVVVTMEGQPIVSIADVQWVLHNAKDTGPVKAEVERGGQKTPLTLTLAAGWRNAAMVKKP
jgi:hypothetical protein